MTTKLLAVSALCLAAFTACPALAGTTAFAIDDGGLADPASIAPLSFAPAPSETLPGAFEALTFQSGGLAASGFNEVAVSKYASVTFGAITGHRVAEPISMAAFSSGMLTLAMLRRGRRRR